MIQPTSYYRPAIYFPFPTRVGRIVENGGHIRRHFDEIVAQWMHSKWATEEWYDQYCPDSRVKLGIDHGWADEHGGWVEQDGRWIYKPRKLGECAATLVAKRLYWEGKSLYDYEGMNRMMQFVTENDLTADPRPDDFRSDVAHVINYLHDIEPNERKVIQWALQALDIWYAGRDCEPDNFTVDHFAELAKAGFERNVPARARDQWVFSWADWLDIAKQAIRKTEMDFWEAESYIRDLPPGSQFVTHSYDDRPVRVAFLRTANRQAGAASRWCRYDVCVQLHPATSPLAGGLQIFRNRRRPYGMVDLRPIAYHLKCLAARSMSDELPSTVEDLTREQWLLPGYAHPWDRVFFFVADETAIGKQGPPGEGVFIKSLTAPGIPNPLLGKEGQVVEVVCSSLEQYQDDPYELSIVSA